MLLMFGPTNLVIRRNGCLYVYLSNESAQDVFFDNLTIQHRRGPVTEQYDYYAFGLEIPGLSKQSNKQNYFANRYKYNGKELQANEFMDGTSLTWKDYEARMYDSQIGRWMIQDQLSEMSRKCCPYSYCASNPIRYIDLDGMIWASKNDKDVADRLQSEISERLKGENETIKKGLESIMKLIGDMEGAGSIDKDNAKLSEAMDNASNAVCNRDQLQESSDELTKMGSTDEKQAFTFKVAGEEGDTYKEKGIIVMEVVIDNNAIHESAHAW